MTLRLRLRLLFSAILGALLVVTVGSALQFREIAAAVDELILAPGTTVEQAQAAAENVRDEATTAAIGLGILGAAVLVIGAWITRMIRTLLLDRLIAIDAAVQSIRRGEST